MLAVAIGLWQQPPMEPAAPLAMMFGDSRSVSMTPSAETDSRTLPRRSGRNPLVWWAALNGRPAEIGAAGWGGHTSAEYDAYWPIVRAQRPRVVIFHGIVNDMNAAIPTGAAIGVADGSFAQACFDRLRARAEEVLSWGGTAIFCTEPLGAGTNQAARIAESGTYDALAAGWAAVRGQPMIDMKAMMRDPSSTESSISLRAGYCYDSPALHLGDVGARQVAQSGFAAALAPIFPQAEPRLNAASIATATQLLTNPCFSPATGGTSNSGVTGSTPANWICELSGTAGMRSATIAASPRGDAMGNDVQLVLTGDAAGQVVRLRSDFTAALQAAQLAAGGAIRIRLLAEFSVTDGDPLASVHGLLQATINGVLIPTATSDMEPQSSTANQSGLYAGRLKTPWFGIAAGATLASCQVRLMLTNSGAGTSAVTFGVTEVEVRPG